MGDRRCANYIVEWSFLIDNWGLHDLMIRMGEQQGTLFQSVGECLFEGETLTKWHTLRRQRDSCS